MPARSRRGAHAGARHARRAASFAPAASDRKRTCCDAMRLGYAGVQMGTRFIASDECRVHPDYKRAIVNAREDDIVLTDKLSGVPCSIIRTPYVDRMGTRAGLLARWMLRGRRTKRLMRARVYGSIPLEASARRFERGELSSVLAGRQKRARNS